MKVITQTSQHQLEIQQLLYDIIRHVKASTVTSATKKRKRTTFEHLTFSPFSLETLVMAKNIMEKNVNSGREAQKPEGRPKHNDRMIHLFILRNNNCQKCCKGQTIYETI